MSCGSDNYNNVGEWPTGEMGATHTAASMLDCLCEMCSQPTRYRMPTDDDAATGEEQLRTDMCVDMGVDMCVDLCVDMCRHVYGHVCRNVCRHVCRHACRHVCGRVR